MLLTYLVHRISDSLAMLDMAAASRQPQVIVGSSIGGWIALHLAKLRPTAVKVQSTSLPGP